RGARRRRAALANSDVIPDAPSGASRDPVNIGLAIGPQTRPSGYWIPDQPCGLSGMTAEVISARMRFHAGRASRGAFSRVSERTRSSFRQFVNAVLTTIVAPPAAVLTFTVCEAWAG